MNRKFSLLSSIFLLAFYIVQGQGFKFQPDHMYQRVSSGYIAAGPTGSVKLPLTVGDKWSEMSAAHAMPAAYKFKSVRDVVRIGINHDTACVISSKYTYRIGLSIKAFNYSTYTNEAGPGTVLPTIYLDVAYDPETKKTFADLATYSFSGYYAFQVTVIDIQEVSGPPASILWSAIARNFYIETEVITQRYDLTPKTIVTRADVDATARKMNVRWLPYNTGGFITCTLSEFDFPYMPDPAAAYKPVSYELEWTYVDDYQFDWASKTSSYAFSSTGNINFDFRKNSTRVQVTDGNAFSIPLVYEHGAIIYRVRSVRPDPIRYKDLIYSDWTLADYGTVNSGAACFPAWGCRILQPHSNDSLNWQYTINFAEDGKYKHVINYLDGSLKSRQTQTKINTESEQIVVVDKVYDFEGRPAIMTLPSPVPQQSLYYRNDITINNTSGKPYKAADFDMLGCSLPAVIPPLAATAMANVYYSGLNPDKASGMARFIPDAEGYPLVQTVYSPDNTNKVEWQGGGGRQLQLWNGHGTRYEYTRANQNELDKYLGTEAGYFEYYPKQIVTDPNGQSSYSIMNPEGKIVVSGLQGTSPGSSTTPIDQLPNYKSGTLECNDLLKGIGQKKDYNILSAYHTFYNDNAGVNTMQYMLTIPAFSFCGSTYKAQGTYSADITTDCGTPVGLSVSGTLLPTDVLTLTPYVYIHRPEYSASIAKGKYLVDKKVTISETNTRNQAKELISLHQPGCFYTPEYFMHQAVNQAAFPCVVPVSDACGSLKKKMMEELYPGAKYGNYTTKPDGTFNSANANSIFSLIPITGTDIPPISNGLGAYNAGGYDVLGNPLHFDTHPFYFYSTTDAAGSYLPANGSVVMNTCTGQYSGIRGPALSATAGIDNVYYTTRVFVSDLNVNGKVSVLCRTKNVNCVEERIPAPAEHPGAPGSPGYLNNVYVNDASVYAYTFSGTVPPDVVSVTLSALKPGWNTIKFKMARICLGCNADFAINIQFSNTCTTCSSTYPSQLRYQSDCISLPVSVNYEGNEYSGLKDLPTDQFIQVFNDQIAEALLPLHPEFCKLALCDGNVFEQQLQNFKTFQQAQAAGFYELSQIISKDPLYTSSGVSYSDLSRFSGAALNMAQQAITDVYCSAGNYLEKNHCATKIYQAEIAAFTFSDPALQQKYFEKLRSYYLVNRRTIQQQRSNNISGSSCGGCALGVVMAQTGDPVFPAGYSSLGDLDPDLPSWLKDQIEHPGTTVPSELTTEMQNDKTDKIAQQVTEIMKRLSNCSNFSLYFETLENNLYAFFAGEGILTPDALSDIISSVPGLNKNDLCHSFLVAYNLYNNEDVKRTNTYRCARPELYDAMTDFLNRTSVLTAIRTAAMGSPSSVFNITIDPDNPFEQKIYTKLGNNTAIQVQGFTETASGGVEVARLKVSYASLPPLNFYIRAKKSTDPSVGLTLGSYLSFSDALCINEDLDASNDGLIAKGTAGIAARTVAGGTYNRYYIWTPSLDLMSDYAENDLEECVTCLDLQEAMSHFKLDKTTYGYAEAYNHPLFERTLTNYLNYRLKQDYTFEDYDQLMRGCAITDRMYIDRLAATYRLEFTSDVAADNFVNNLNTVTARPDFLRYKTSATGNPVLLLDFNNIPENRLLSWKLTCDGVSGGVAARQWLFSPDNEYSYIFTAAGCTAFNPATYTSLNTTTDAWVWQNGAYTASANYKLHILKDDLPFSPYSIRSTSDLFSYMSAALYNPASGACNSNYCYFNKQVLRSDDYGTAFKAAYLAYIYGLGLTDHQEIAEALTPAAVQAALSGYSSKTLSYDDPYCKGTRKDLYAYLPAAAAPVPANITLLKNTILGNVASANSNKLFLNADFTYNTIPSGNVLAVIRKANGDYWYRYYDATDHLYNVYITPPAGLGVAPATLTLPSAASITLGPGSRTFYVDMYSAATGTVRCTGHTDFSLANAGSEVARDVILYRQSQQLSCFDSADCERQVLADANASGKAAYQLYYDSAVNQLTRDMITFWINNAVDTLIHCGQQSQYQQTLYYYDRVGNLTRTVPPAGVTEVTGFTLTNTTRYRNSPLLYAAEAPLPIGGGAPDMTGEKLTKHTKVSSYQYNALNQLVYQKTPDGGTVYYFYDAAGRQIFSQNSRQRADGKYMYSLYDQQGRPMESGLVKLGCTYPASSTSDFDLTPCYFYLRNQTSGPQELSAHPDFVRNSNDEATYPYETLIGYIRSKAREEVVLTSYDEMTTDLGTVSGEMLSTQENLRSRVAAIKYYGNLPAATAPMPANAAFSTYYSYDLGGNVQTITYDFYQLQALGQRYKRVDYDYDQISGKVNLISYNRGRGDQFYQQYDYDADNRITKVNTSNDGITWNRDAAYTYYKHGPLATLKLGNQKIQSLEYAYTIQGWLKAINGDVLRPDKDMGANGGSGDITYARDVVAHTLGYYKDDYKIIGSSTAGVTLPATDNSLYNGNIVQQTTSISALGNMQRTYQYDQLQRLKFSSNKSVNEVAATPFVDAATPANLYGSSYSYDKDGNILTLSRYDGSATPQKIDQFTYSYATGNNRLLQVQDAGTASGFTDLKTGQPADNYAYDRTGNLVRDKQGAELIQWDRFGKVKSIRDTVTQRYINFEYDGKGNRTWKEVTARSGTNEDRLGEYYVRDAGGNMLSVYNTHSVYSKSVWMSALTSTITKSALTPVLSSYIDRSLPTRLISLLSAGHSTWYNTYTNSGKPISYYLAADATLKNNLITSGEDWIDALRTSNATFYRNTFLAARMDAQNFFLASTGYYNPRQSLMTLLYNNFPASALTTVWNSASATFVPGNLSQSLTNMNTALTGSALITGPRRTALGLAIINMIVGYIDAGASYSSTFYTQMIADNSLWQSTSLRGPTGSSWTTTIRSLTNTYGDNTQFGTFFNSWSGANAALAACTSPDYKLRTLYNINPPWTFSDMLTEATTADITNVLSAMDDLTTAELSDVLVARGAMDEYQVLSLWANIGDTLSLGEHHIYGSSRVGVQRYDNLEVSKRSFTSGSIKRLDLGNRYPWYSYEYGELIDSTVKEPYGTLGNTYINTLRTNRTLGRKYYELTDHLGNVLATVLDRKTGAGGTSSLYSYWVADIASSADYYPGGMMMPGRNTEYSWNRMGAQSQPKDDEIYGKGNVYAFKYRMEDARINRFFSVDPLSAQYPYYSPYHFAGNTLIAAIDVEGKEPGVKEMYDLIRPLITNKTAGEIVDGVYRNTPAGMAEGQVNNIITNPLDFFINAGNPINQVKQVVEGSITTVNNAVSGKDAGAWVDLAVMGAGAAEGFRASKGAVSKVPEMAPLTEKVQQTANNMAQSGEYPATVVGGQLPNGSSAVGTSGAPPVDIAPTLLNEAEKYGGIGTKRNGNVIGCCGEFHVANKLLKENPGYKPSDVKFTPAIRPRTGQEVPPCQNCKDIFSVEKKR